MQAVVKELKAEQKRLRASLGQVERILGKLNGEPVKVRKKRGPNKVKRSALGRTPDLPGVAGDTPPSFNEEQEAREKRERLAKVRAARKTAKGPLGRKTSKKSE